jgi:hypothetical protein
VHERANAPRAGSIGRLYLDDIRTHVGQQFTRQLTQLVAIFDYPEV